MVFQYFASMIGETEEIKEKFAVTKEKKLNDEKIFLSNLAKHVNKNSSNETGENPQEKADNLSRLSGFGLGIGSLYLQEALGYPLIVLRRQCQVNHGAVRYHILPFSLFRVIGRINHRQGINVFWKGWGSSCIVKGVTILTEVAICELLHIPRETIDKEEINKSNMKTVCVHETLKGVSLLLTLPLYSASLTDSIQTLTLDGSRSMFTFFKDAAYRVIGWYSSRGHGRLLPIYSLIIPSIVYGVVRYTIKSFLSYFLMRMNVGRYSIDDKMNKKSMKKIYYTELVSSLLSCLLTDMLMYPFETCILRLHLQGTRTIIDDTDKGIGVVPICTNYDGLFDCVQTIKRQEGLPGFYKGFGALIIQYVLQFMVVKLSKPFLF